ncbi:hypothetical protein TNCV_2314891 [Trichonephila clavipes]|nr:hypothetical protein TNCV_2314891 [Trichonephila clavipes]
MAIKERAVGSLVVGALDSRQEGLVLMPDATKYPPSTPRARRTCSLNQWVVSPSIVSSGNFAELNRSVTCMVLKANDRRTSRPLHDEFRGSRSDYVRQVALETTTKFLSKNRRLVHRNV